MQLKGNSKVKNFNRKTSTIKVLNDEHTNIQIMKKREQCFNRKKIRKVEKEYKNMKN